VRHRRIGSTDLVASEVGLAVWSLVAGEGARSDEDAAALLGAALDLGLAYFECTDSDDHGRAEELLGQAVRGHRDEVTVAGPTLDRSLQRLRLEPIDLWLLHHPGMDAIEFDELFELLESQVQKGKIRHYGVLLGPGPGWGDEGAAALGERRVAAVETVYNLAEQSPGRDLAALAAETGAGLVVRDPLAPRLDTAARARLEFLERDRGRTLDQALLRFALADPAVATALPEVRDRDHLAELAGAADLDPLTTEDLDRIAELHAGGAL
jgi:aryl-alcohol dehydrogenase-like predicted oxidoreductase